MTPAEAGWALVGLAIGLGGGLALAVWARILRPADVRAWMPTGRRAQEGDRGHGIDRHDLRQHGAEHVATERTGIAAVRAEVERAGRNELAGKHRHGAYARPVIW